MTSFELFVIAGLGLSVLLLLALLLRKSTGAAELAQWSAQAAAQTATLARLEGGLQTVASAQEARLASLAQSMTKSLENMRDIIERQLQQTLADARAGRGELAQGFTAFEQRAERQATTLKTEVDGRLATMTAALHAQLEGNGGQLKLQLSMIRDSVAQQLASLTQSSLQQANQLRATLNERLATIQADNAAKLDEMRKTVDEKLHATLEQRLGQSFLLVSEQLEQVHRGLGEMQTLAAGVGDLKRVLTNVKTRGTWGEVQLEAMIGQILAAEQYATHVATRPASSERVEIAIRLPGSSPRQPVWLPIDAKFPLEDYQRLLDAHDRADADAVEAAAKALETRLKQEAKTIREKYVEPPFTTDFAVLYLPTEGLYAEALRRPALAETLQREQRIILAGPTTLTALLNSLQMGFRTLAIEKRASEVWQVLGQVKTEFGKFGEVVEATKTKLDQARSQFDKIGTRSRAIERKLREVEALPMVEGEASTDLPEAMD